MRAAAAACLLALAALPACRGGPVGMPISPLETLPTRGTPVPDEPDHAAHDLAAAALAGGPARVRAELARLETLERVRTQAGEPPSGLVPYAHHLADATLHDEIASRRAAARLLERDDLDPSLRRHLEMEVADDPLRLAETRLAESRRARLARGVNAFSAAIGRSVVSVALAPVRLVQAAIGVAVAEHLDDPISVQERQALAHWKRYVEMFPDSPETPALLARIDRLQRRWFSMRRERSVRAARLALENGENELAFVLADRALAYAPEDGEAATLRAEAQRRVRRERAALARSLAAPRLPPADARSPRARALSVALLEPDGDVARAAGALLAAPADRALAGEARFARALALSERGHESDAWAELGELAQERDAGAPMARHARALVESPAQNPYGAFQRARVADVGERTGFVVLGPIAHGARDRDLPRALEWLLEGPALVSTLGGIPARLVHTAVSSSRSRAPAALAARYLALHPDGEHAETVRAWLVDHEADAGRFVRAWRFASEGDAVAPERVAELAAAAAGQMLEQARAERRRDLRLALLGETAERFPDTESGRKAGELVREEIERATAQSIRISRGFLLENPRVAGPGGLGLAPALLDRRPENGELHAEGVRLVGGRTIEFALLAASGDPDDPPERLRREVSKERLARLAALLEETALRNALLDPLAARAPDADRDLFLERARLGVADTPDLRATAESTYAFVGVREKYGMVRSRESILPVELVVQGSFPDLGLGAFPRLRLPKTTPDAVLYR
jgi:hypothetical protein